MGYCTLYMMKDPDMMKNVQQNIEHRCVKTPLFGESCEFHCKDQPLPQGSAAVHRKSSTAHCPQAVRYCAKGVLLPTAPG